MSKSEDKGKRPARRMGLLIAFLIIGAVILIALWMREPPPGVNPTGEAPQVLRLAWAPQGSCWHEPGPSRATSSGAHSLLVRWNCR
jgi:hypothetical protein